MRKYLAILFVVYACHSAKQDKPSVAEKITDTVSITIPNITVRTTDTSLVLNNGIWFYHQQPFTGFIETYYVSGSLKSRQSFYNGKDEGLVLSYYEDGSKDARRFYHNGEKDSINQGWWPNGNRRFEYHFNNGVYEGDFKEWYQSGKPLKHIVYHDGKEQSGKGWRENGKIYMSFVVKEGRLYGLVNPNLCYSLKNERGEFVESSR
jgi:antitoxin component YwqK of YwqJK toxin-antitoxin module